MDHATLQARHAAALAADRAIKRAGKARALAGATPGAAVRAAEALGAPVTRGLGGLTREPRAAYRRTDSRTALPLCGQVHVPGGVDTATPPTHGRVTPRVQTLASAVDTVIAALVRGEPLSRVADLARGLPRTELRRLYSHLPSRDARRSLARLLAP